MKKKILGFALATGLALSAVGLVACGGGGNGGNGGHTHAYRDTQEFVEATCTEGGYEIRACSCGETSRVNEVPALGHDWTAWSYLNDATYDANGTNKRTCNRCSASETETAEETQLSRFGFNAVSVNDQLGYELVSYNGAESTATEIVVPSTYKGKPVLSIKSFVEGGRWVADITKVTVPDSVVKICATAFGDFYALQTIVLGNGIKEIGNEAFLSSERTLKSVIYNGTVEEWVAINFEGYRANPVRAARSLTIGDTLLTSVNLTTVESISDYAFYGCDTIQTVVIGDSVKTIGAYAFSECKNLKSVDIGDNVTVISSNAFGNCEKLIDLTLGAKVETIKDMAFGGDYALYQLTLPASLTSIEYGAFRACRRIVEVINHSSVEINPGASIVGGNVKSIITDVADSKVAIVDGYIVYDDGTLRFLIGTTKTDKELTLPLSINGHDYDICEYAFYNSDITKVVMSTGVKVIGERAFYLCGDLQSVAIGKNVTRIENSAFNGCVKLWDLKMANEEYGYGDNVIYIGDSAFYCTALTTVSFPSTLNYVGSYAFAGAHINFVSSLSLEKSYFESNLDKRNLLEYDPLYETPVSKNLNVANKTIVKDDFVFHYNELASRFILTAYVGTATEITLPTDIEGHEYSIANYAFRDYGGTDNLVQLTKVTIPDNAVSSIGNNVFESQESLTEVHIGAGVTSIGKEAFKYCYALATLTFGEGLTTICEDAFYACGDLTVIVLPNSLETLEKNAFSGCGLVNITMGNNVTSIGQSALSIHYNGGEITFGGTQAEWNAITKADGWLYASGNYVIHCTDGDISNS